MDRHHGGQGDGMAGRCIDGARMRGMHKGTLEPRSMGEGRLGRGRRGGAAKRTGKGIGVGMTGAGRGRDGGRGGGVGPFTNPPPIHNPCNNHPTQD